MNRSLGWPSILVMLRCLVVVGAVAVVGCGAGGGQAMDPPHPDSGGGPDVCRVGIISATAMPEASNPSTCNTANLTLSLDVFGDGSTSIQADLGNVHASALDCQEACTPDGTATVTCGASDVVTGVVLSACTSSGACTVTATVGVQRCVYVGATN